MDRMTAEQLAELRDAGGAIDEGGDGGGDESDGMEEADTHAPVASP